MYQRKERIRMHQQTMRVSSHVRDYLELICHDVEVIKNNQEIIKEDLEMVKQL